MLLKILKCNQLVWPDVAVLPSASWTSGKSGTYLSAHTADLDPSHIRPYAWDTFDPLSALKQSQPTLLPLMPAAEKTNEGRTCLLSSSEPEGGREGGRGRKEGEEGMEGWRDGGRYGGDKGRYGGDRGRYGGDGGRGGGREGWRGRMEG